MKYFLTLLTGILLAYAGKSQLRVGVLGGPHTANVIEKNDIPGWDTTEKLLYSKKSGFNFGLIAEIPLNASNRLFFQPAIMYHSKGRKYAKINDTTLIDTDTLNIKSNFSTNYIDVPLNITYKLRFGKKSSFMISAGPYISFWYNGKNTVETLVANSDTTVVFRKIPNKIDVGKGTNKVKMVDFGVNARVGFELGSILLTGFISQGLTEFYQPDYNTSLKHQVYGASVGFWLNPPTKLKPRDRDSDGIPDKSDGCPEQPGTAATGGCPDRDGDGIADGVDKCADVAGLAKYSGCPIPDTDKDGVNDEEDNCIDKPGLAKYKGCPIPDTDGDGLNDESDACPDKAGTVEFNGCPIPDSDGDGLNDKEDKCPTEAGIKENNGCPAVKQEIVEKVNYVARNVLFKLGSDKLTADSYIALDELVDVMQKNTGLRLSIDGFTDSTGSPKLNLSLSQKRADAVKKYLVQKSVDAARIKSVGHGQENPVAENSTEEGRAKNRRVEMKVEQ